MGIPLLFILLVSGASNCRVALAWIYRRFFGPTWDTEARLKNDLRPHVQYGLSFRIQTIGEAFASITMATWAPSADRAIHSVSGLGDDDLSAVVSAIDLNPLNSFRMEEKANIRHSDLLLFLSHHPNLKDLGLLPHSIRASSLIIPDASAPSSIVSLSAPALYIPYIIPITPVLTSISILFHPMRTHLASQRVALSQYRRALNCVVSLPGTHALSLSLSFPSDASNLPWLNVPHDDGASAPEVRLHRVTDLLLAGNLSGIAGFSAATLHALPRWLRLFPALKKVTVLPGTRQRAIPVSQRQELIKAISDACRGVDSEDVTL